MTTVRDRVNMMLFGGQHEAIIEWIERLDRELNTYRIEGELMPAQDQVVMEGVTIIFRNFEGKEGQYNRKGVRNFGVLLSDEVANAMAEDDWNVKWLKPQESDEDATPQAWLPVEVAFDKGRPPHVVLVTSRGRTTLDESQVEMLDWADITNVDLIVRPYHWDVNDRTGVKAYLKSIYVTIEEDALEIKYATMDQPQPAAS